MTRVTAKPVVVPPAPMTAATEVAPVEQPAATVANGVAETTRPLTGSDVDRTPRLATAGTGVNQVMLTRLQNSGVHPFVADIKEISARNAAALREQNLELLRKNGEADPEAKLQALEKQAGDQLQVLVRRSAKGFTGILRDLRMKTVWEEPGKRDSKYLEYREETERALGMFGYRPCYGYASVDASTRGACTEYGDIVLGLKGVADRTSFCLFDSFDQGTRENYEQNCFTFKDVAELLVNQQLTGLFKEMPYAYDEAQIFGGVVAADIARVEIPDDPAYDELAQRTHEVMPWAEVARYTKPKSEP
jgi:hypothetical protein